MIERLLPENPNWYYDITFEELMNIILEEEKIHGRAILI